MIHVGQELIGKFQYGEFMGGRTHLAFPHGIVTEVKEDSFKVKYAYLKGMEYPYKMEDLGKIVYERKEDAEKSGNPRIAQGNNPVLSHMLKQEKDNNLLNEKGYK